jgi:hypothetical protein
MIPMDPAATLARFDTDLFDLGERLGHGFP